MTVQKVNITHMEVERTGTSKDGKEWTLYNVACESLDGQTLPPGPLKTFDALTGEVMVRFEPFVNARSGIVEHHTMKRADVKRAVRGATPRFDGPAVSPDERIASLEARVLRLESQLSALITAINTDQPVEVDA